MPIRLRITLWTAGILLISLLGLSVGVYYTMPRTTCATNSTLG